MSSGTAMSAALAQGGPPLAPPLAPPPAPPGWPPGAPATSAPLGPAWQADAAGLRGLNWVAICRWAMGVYGALLVLLLIVIGLAVHNVTVPVQAADGTTTYVSVDLGPALAIVAIIAALIFALVIWLLQFTVARGIVLGLEVIGLLGLLGNTHTFSGSSAYAVGTIVGAVVNLFFIVALTMSLIYRRPT